MNVTHQYCDDDDDENEDDGGGDTVSLNFVLNS